MWALEVVITGMFPSLDRTVCVCARPQAVCRSNNSSSSSSCNCSIGRGGHLHVTEGEADEDDDQDLAGDDFQMLYPSYSEAMSHLQPEDAQVSRFQSPTCNTVLREGGRIFVAQFCVNGVSTTSIWCPCTWEDAEVSWSPVFNRTYAQPC